MSGFCYWILAGGLLCFHFAKAQDSSQKERLRLLQAESFRRVEIDGKVVHELAGDVIMEQGDTRICCDLATQFPNSGNAILTGHVKIVDDEQTLIADTVVVFEKEQKQVASGNVVSITASDTTAADKMTYFQDSGKLLTEGQVRIVNKQDLMSITGGAAEFWRESRRGNVWGAPVLTNFDSLGVVASRIEADTLKIFDDGDSTIAVGNVRIKQESATATSGRALYKKRKEYAILSEHPQVQQRHQKISGDTLDLHLEESKLKRVHVLGNAVALSPADTLHDDLENKFTGASMDFFFEDGQLDRIVVENQATALYHIIEEGKYKGANEISGDRLEIDLSEEAVQRVFVTSNPDVAEGKYVPPR